MKSVVSLLDLGEHFFLPRGFSFQLPTSTLKEKSWLSFHKVNKDTWMCYIDILKHKYLKSKNSVQEGWRGYNEEKQDSGCQVTFLNGGVFSIGEQFSKQMTIGKPCGTYLTPLVLTKKHLK